MRIAEAFSFLTASFKEWNIESPFFESELLLMHFLEIERTQLHLSPEKDITPAQWQNLRAALARRLSGEPMAYILGYKDFYKERFSVAPGVLIPRPETELILDVALEMNSMKGPFTEVADLGAGSGCIGLSLLKELPNSRLWTWDISEDAKRVFDINAEHLGLMDRITYSLGDPSENPVENRYDLIVSNPPYISESDDRVEADVRRHEPAMALFAVDGGLAFYNAWLPWAYTALKKGGYAIFEFGDGQGADVTSVAIACGFKTWELYKDLSGKERVIAAQK